MLKRRTSAGIVGEILKLESAGKTEIMYSVNLSYKQVGNYLGFLMQRGLLTRETEGHRIPHYVVTEAGQGLLEHIESVISTLDLEDLGF